jgi:hypothetical protein
MWKYNVDKTCQSSVHVITLGELNELWCPSQLNVLRSGNTFKYIITAGNGERRSTGIEITGHEAVIVKCNRLQSPPLIMTHSRGLCIIMHLPFKEKDKPSALAHKSVNLEQTLRRINCRQEWWQASKGDKLPPV